MDGASLATFRIGFGLIMMWEAFRFFDHDWIARFWIRPEFHFTYYGFSWVRPWPGDGMYVHVVIMGLLAFLLAIGLWHRVVATLFWLSFTYIFLLEQSRYLNHFYAASLFAFLLAVTPASAVWSVDAWRRRRAGTADVAVPRWSLWLLRGQMGVIYAYAGIAKLNAEWLAGGSMENVVAYNAQRPLITWLTELGIGASFLAYGGLAFDLLVVPALLWRRTRFLALSAAAAFHIMNAHFFNIGIFPWFAFAATTLFLEPCWPRRALRWLSGHASWSRMPEPAPGNARPALGYSTAAFLVGYAVLQLTIPLRHYLYPGAVTWTEEGHRFSWRMMLRAKSGTSRFFVTDSVGATTVIIPTKYLADFQAATMANRPDMVLQFAHFLGKRYGSALGPATVKAEVTVRLNQRPPTLLVDPAVDLASQPRNLRAASWITTSPSGLQ